MNTTIAVSDLAFKFDQIIVENNEQEFFIKLVDYGKYLLDNDIDKKYLNSLYENSKNDVRKYEETCKMFESKWNELSSDLLRIASLANITDSPNNPLENQITEIASSLKESISCDDNYIYRRFSNYRELLNRMTVKLGLSRFMPKHIILDDNNEKLYILFDCYDRTQIEWEKFKRSREIKTWWAHYQIMRLTYGVLEIEDKNKYFSNDKQIDELYKYEFNRIGTGRFETLVFLKKNKYLNWIKNLHSYLIPRLSSSNDRADGNYTLVEGEIEKRIKRETKAILDRIKDQIINEHAGNNGLNNKMIKCGNISYYFETSTLTYKKKSKVISPDTREMKFFFCLEKNRSQTVEYKTIAKYCDSQTYKQEIKDGVSDNNMKNKDFSSEASLLRRDFRKLLVSMGMPNEEFNSMVQTISKTGYKLLD